MTPYNLSLLSPMHLGNQVDEHRNGIFDNRVIGIELLNKYNGASGRRTTNTIPIKKTESLRDGGIGKLIQCNLMLSVRLVFREVLCEGFKAREGSLCSLYSDVERMDQKSVSGHGRE